MARCEKRTDCKRQYDAAESSGKLAGQSCRPWQYIQAMIIHGLSNWYHARRGMSKYHLDTTPACDSRYAYHLHPADPLVLQRSTVKTPCIEFTDVCIQITAIYIGAHLLLCTSLRLCRFVKRRDVMHACLCRQTKLSMQLPCGCAACMSMVCLIAGAWAVWSKASETDTLDYDCYRIQHKIKCTQRR